MYETCCYFLRAGPGTQQVAATVGKPDVVVAAVSSKAGQAVGCGPRLAVEIGPEAVAGHAQEPIHLEWQQTKHEQQGQRGFGTQIARNEIECRGILARENN